MSQFTSIEGYGKNPEYDGEYLPGHDFDPKVVFAHSGDPEAQAIAQEEFQDGIAANKYVADKTQLAVAEERVKTLKEEVKQAEKDGVPTSEAFKTQQAEAKATAERIKEEQAAAPTATQASDETPSFVTGSQTIDYTKSQSQPEPKKSYSSKSEPKAVPKK